MQSLKNNFVSIKRKNFGNANSKVFLVLMALFFSLGIMGIFLNWKIGLCSISILAIAYLLLKNDILKITPVIFIVLLSAFGVYHFLDLDFLEVMLTTLFLSVAFFLKPLYEVTKEDNEFELFFLDKENLRCLVKKDNYYNGYAFNPKGYLKNYCTKNIKSITFQGKHLSISIGGRIIRPRELTIENIQKINLFVQQHLPDLWNNEIVFKESLKAENKFYLNKLFISSPVIILSAVIYFFGDNGRDKVLTYICLILMIVLPLIIYRMLRQR